MARPLRIEFPGAIYHVTSRMIGSWQSERNRLFRDRPDYERFLERLEERIKDYGIRLYLFCLMSNHFHLLLETPQGNVSRFMQSLATAYTVYYNLRHKRHGHLLDGRFKAKIVSGDDYLLKLSRYVHLNPVWVAGWRKRALAERVKHLRQYRWSSYRGYIGQTPSWPFVDEGPLLALLGRGSGSHRRAYRQFVEAGLANSDDEFIHAMRASPIGIGGEPFLQRAESRRADKMARRNRLEDVAFRRVVQPLEALTVMRIVSEVMEEEPAALLKRRRDSPLRAVAAKCLTRYAGLTQREVAEALHLGTGASVSAQILGWSQRVKTDPTLERRMNRIQRLINIERKKAAASGEPLLKL